MSDNPNLISVETFKALKARFNGKLTPEEAMATLLDARDDKTMTPKLRLETHGAILDLNEGRSVQSAMARFRRAVGLDPEKRPKDEFPYG